MKKGILLVLILLLIIQVVSAEIVLDHFESPYNKGEEVTISGILRNLEVENGFLEFQLICNGMDFNLLTTVDAEENKEFKTSFIVPSAAEGDCYIKTFLMFNGDIIEEEDSELFEISDELDVEGDFQVNPIQVQLGKTLRFYGYITKDVNDPLIGLATIYFRNEDRSYYIKDIEISDGRLDYDYTAVDNKPGEYSVNVLVRDSYGNEKLFDDVASFNIVDEVHVFVEPIQKKVLPGSTVQLSGEVNTVLGEAIKEGVIQIIFEDELFTANIKDGKFSYDLKLSEDIETGEHNLKFSFVEEETGNWGSSERILYVEAVLEKIRIDIFQETVKPQELLEVAVFIYDQADDKIEDSIKVELTDSNDKPIFIDYVEAGDKTSIEIAQYAVPGSWNFKASYLGLEEEEEVIVEEVKNIEVDLVNQTLYIKNTGNVVYKETVSINLDNDEFVFKKKISLIPEETLTIDLTEEAPSGEYDNLKVTGAAVGANQFSDVLIVGKNKRSLNFIYSILLILVIGSLAYLTIFKRRHFDILRKRSARDSKHARWRLKELREKKENEPKGTVFSREQSVSDFRERMLKDIRETEDKIKSESQSSSSSYDSDSKKKKDDLPSGMFNMFN